jgi:hypothetical protein
MQTYTDWHEDLAEAATRVANIVVADLKAKDLAQRGFLSRSLAGLVWDHLTAHMDSVMTPTLDTLLTKLGEMSVDQLVKLLFEHKQRMASTQSNARAGE